MSKYVCRAYNGAEIILSTMNQVRCILSLCNMQWRVLTIQQSLVSHIFIADAREVASFNTMAAKGGSDAGSKSLDSCIIHRTTVREGRQLNWTEPLDLKAF